MNISMNSTKQQIFDAYTDAVKKLQTKSANILDPAKEMATKKSSEILSNAQIVVETSVEEAIKTLQDKMIVALTGMSSEFIAQVSSLKNLEDAISIKEAELNEVFDIEKTAHTLAGLVNAHQELKERYASEKEELQNQIDDLENVLSDRKALLEKELKELRVEARKVHDREEADYKYDFDRKKKEEADALEDELAKKEKAFNDKLQLRKAIVDASEKSLNEREEAINEKELKLDELNAQIATIPSRLEEVKKTTEEETKKNMNAHFAIKESFANKQFESEKKVLQAEIDMLKNSNKEKDEALKAALVKLDAAYEKIQNMALATVDGSKSAEALNSIQKFASTNSNK